MYLFWCQIAQFAFSIIAHALLRPKSAIINLFGSFKPNLNFIDDGPDCDNYPRLAGTIDSLKIGLPDFTSHGSYEYCFKINRTRIN